MAAHLDLAKDYYAPAPAGGPFSVPLPGSQIPGRSAVYRHWRFRDGLLKSLDPNVAKRQPSNRCLGFRPYDPVSKTYGKYQWLTYGTVQKRRADFGAGIVRVCQDAGVMEQKHGVGLWCQNRPEWQITDLACMSQSLFSVSLYDTLGPSATEYIISHASLPCVVSSLPHIPTLLKLKPRLPCLKVIISMDSVENGEQEGQSKLALLKAIASDLDVAIYSMEQVEALGGANGTPVYRIPTSSDVITINYTSGTTGPPKGVTLTHAAAVAAASSSNTTVLQGPSTSMMSYLPLAHIYARMTEHGALWAGGQIGYFHGDVLGLVDDLKALRPTTFTSVPRLYNRFGGAVRAATVDQPGFKGALSRHVMSTKLANMEPADSPSARYKHAIYDRIWGQKVASALGLQNATDMVSGSAPLDPTLHRFFRAAFGTRLVQGYGLTETYGQGLCQLTGDMSVGNCGALAPTMEICLLDVPDMEYFATDKPQPRGELLIRGNSLFSGYYRNEEETAKSMTPDGWFCTGDIATVDSQGRFQIIDRRKNVLKLAQGEYISPERIENIYLSHLSYLATAYVHGDSMQTFLVAIFGVQPDMFAVYASKILGKTIEPTDMQAIAAACNDVKVRKAVLKELDKIGKKNGFAGYERVRNCYLMLDPFTIDNELLTPTLKLKRPPTAKMYRKQLDDLYAEALAEEQSGKNIKAKL
ncbi:medium-chain fatty acid-CoA ligase faa2 [Lecanora helva]